MVMKKMNPSRWITTCPHCLVCGLPWSVSVTLADTSRAELFKRLELNSAVSWKGPSSFNESSRVVQRTQDWPWVNCFHFKPFLTSAVTEQSVSWVNQPVFPLLFLKFWSFFNQLGLFYLLTKDFSPEGTVQTGTQSSWQHKILPHQVKVDKSHLCLSALG